jgi:hypothetical protein
MNEFKTINISLSIRKSKKKSKWSPKLKYGASKQWNSVQPVKCPHMTVYIFPNSQTAM